MAGMVNDELCPYCNGTGNDPCIYWHMLPCPRCKGTGKKSKWGNCTWVNLWS